MTDRHKLVTRVILVIGWIGLVFRLVVMTQSNGSNDFYVWQAHAQILHDHGFLWAYANTGNGTPYQLYNHPPLPGLYAMLCSSLAGTDTHLFAVLFKIPCLLAEILAALVLKNIWKHRKNERAGAIAFAAYALALGPIAVAAYHCNTDAVSASLALLACERSARNRHGSAGLALAAALSVKLIPVFLAPLLFFRAPSLKSKARWAAGAAMVLVPFLPFVMHFGDVMRSTFGYAPRLEHWGLPYLFEMLATDLPSHAGPFTYARMFAINYGKDLILLVSVAVGFVAARNRHASPYAGAALALLAFLVFTPGFGVQYVIAVAPVLFAYDVGIGFAYATLSGVFVSLVYISFLVPGRAPYVSFFDNFYSPGTSAVGLLTWGYCALLLFRIKMRARSAAGCRQSDGATS
ncbi:MAG: glycosyltransferase 87 family protein [Polyangiaceae bacterium]